MMTDTKRPVPFNSPRWVALAAILGAFLSSDSQAAAQAATGSPAGPRSSALPFSDLTYGAAREAASRAGKLCVVDAMASWCVPCAQMERETWPAAEVTAWLADHAMAVELDVDAQKEIAAELKITALPTIIIFRDDTELDRREGKLQASELVKWLEDVDAGRAGHDPLAARGLALLHSDDIQARMDVARELLSHGEYKLALQHYLWLWPNTRSVPKWFGVRASFMLYDMKRLAAVDDDCNEAVTKLWMEVRHAVVSTSSPDAIDWFEFTAWCSIFDHQDEPLAWFDRHREADGSVNVPDTIKESLLKLLFEAHRCVEAGQLGGLPALADERIARYRGVRLEARTTPDIDDKLRIGMIETEQGSLRVVLAQLAAATWAAGRDGEARGYAQSLLAELDDAESRIVLAQMTLDAVGARPEVSAWLDEAAAKGGGAQRIADQRARLRAAERAAKSGAIPGPSQGQ